MPGLNPFSWLLSVCLFAGVIFISALAGIVA